MSIYDMLPRGSQVKLWDCTMETKQVGDVVSSFGLEKYIVLLREGGYVIVEKGIITKIVENYGRKFYYPEDFPNIPCVDKWGAPIQCREDLAGTLSNIFADPYYYPIKEGK